MYTRIDNILIEMRLKVGKLFDMYKTYVRRENYIFFKCSSIFYLNAHEKIIARTDIVKEMFSHLKERFNRSSENKSLCVRPGIFH